jgi:hypothetical protein
MKNKLKSLGLIIVFLMACSAISHGQSGPFDNHQEYLIDGWATVLLWVDLDNDGLKDIIASGYKKDFYIDYSNLEPWQDSIPGDTVYYESAYSFYAYRNKGNSEFERLDNISLGAIFNPMVNTADFDNNGYMDIIIAGQSLEDYGFKNKTLICKNNGNWYFEILEPENIPGLDFGGISIVDFNNDGRTDVFINGQDAAGDVYSMLYLNHGDFEFAPDSKLRLKGCVEETVLHGWIMISDGLCRSLDKLERHVTEDRHAI